MISPGRAADISILVELYDNLNDYLATHINYPGWIKGIYPVRQTAESAVAENSLFIYRLNNTIVGSIVLNNTPEPAYTTVDWTVQGMDSEILVIRTLVVAPAYQGQGIASQLLDFARQYAIAQGQRAIRLDVSEKNTPAIALYKKAGYQYVDTVDLGLGYAHLKYFKLYELALPRSEMNKSA